MEAARIAELSVAIHMQEMNIKSLQDQIEQIPGEYIPVTSMGLYGVATVGLAISARGLYNFGRLFTSKGNKLNFILGVALTLSGGALTGATYTAGKTYEDQVNQQNSVLKSEVLELLKRQSIELATNRESLEGKLESLSAAVPNLKQKLAQVMESESYRSQVISKLLQNLSDARGNLSEQKTEMLTASSLAGLSALVFLRSAIDLTIQRRGNLNQAKTLLSSKWALGTVALLGAWTSLEVFQWQKAKQEIETLESDLETIEADFIKSVREKLN